MPDDYDPRLDKSDSTGFWMGCGLGAVGILAAIALLALAIGWYFSQSSFSHAFGG